MAGSLVRCVDLTKKKNVTNASQLQSPLEYSHSHGHNQNKVKYLNCRTVIPYASTGQLYVVIHVIGPILVGHFPPVIFTVLDLLSFFIIGVAAVSSPAKEFGALDGRHKAELPVPEFGNSILRILWSPKHVLLTSLTHNSHHGNKSPSSTTVESLQDRDNQQLRNLATDLVSFLVDASGGQKGPGPTRFYG